MKKCPICATEKPPSDFAKRKSNPDGLSACCVSCNKTPGKPTDWASRKVYYEKKMASRLATISSFPAQKSCVICGIEKLRSMFRGKISSSDLISDICRECSANKSLREGRARYYIKHKDKVKYHARNSAEKIKKDPVRLEAQRARARRYATEMRPAKMAEHRLRMESDVEYREKFLMEQRIKTAKRRSIIGGSFSPAEFWETIVKSNGRCLRCDDILLDPTVDHILPVARGGSNYIHNIQPLCMQCNTAKNAKFIDYRSWTMDMDEIGLGA